MSEKGEGLGMGMAWGLLTGAAVGAGVALLFAPCSGKETRGWLAQRTRSLKDTTSNAIVQGMDAVQRVTKEIGTDGEAGTMVHERTAHAKPPTTPMRG